MKLKINDYHSHLSTWNWKTPEWFNKPVQSVLNFAWNSWWSKFDRKIKLKISKDDLFNLDMTISMTMAPIIKEFRKAAKSYPSTLDSIEEWYEILDKIIWAFEQIAADDWDDQYYTGEADYRAATTEDGFMSIEHGPNHTLEFDKEGYAAHNDRIAEGLDLFSRYLRNMWL